MTDQPKAATDPYRTPVVFVSQLVGGGHLNGVANFTFATSLFTPNEEGKIDPDFVITARLRMDMAAVLQLRDACDKILQENLKPANGTTH